MNIWPEDVLIIHYPKLAQDAETRLRVLGLIGMLLNKSPGNYNEVSLGCSENDWYLLCSWLHAGNTDYFWHVEPQSKEIQVTCLCEKHLLVGTKLLLTDLAPHEKHSSLQQSIDDVWETVRCYIQSGYRTAEEVDQ